MDSLPLPQHLIDALMIIHERKSEAIPKSDIEVLLKDNWIAERQSGWALSIKGRDLLSQFGVTKRRSLRRRFKSNRITFVEQEAK